MLVAATVVALVWANSPRPATVVLAHPNRRRCRPPGVRRGPGALGQRRPDGAVLLRGRPGDQARAGRRRAPRSAARRCPSLGALGGMVVPAAIYLAFNAGGPASTAGASRWPPTSRSRSGSSPSLGPGAAALKVLLLDAGHRRRHRRHRRDRRLLHRADQLGVAPRRRSASWRWSCCMRRAHVWYMPLYVVAGVACGSRVRVRHPRHYRRGRAGPAHARPAVPARARAPSGRRRLDDQTELTAERGPAAVGLALRSRSRLPSGSKSAAPLDQLPRRPDLRPRQRRDPAHRRRSATPPPHRSLVGVVAGLVAGKLVGVSAFTWLAVRPRAGCRPRRCRLAARSPGWPPSAASGSPCPCSSPAWRSPAVSWRPRRKPGFWLAPSSRLFWVHCSSLPAGEVRATRRQSP